MLDRLAPKRDLVGTIVEPLLDALQDILVLPAADAALLARGAPVLDGAGYAIVRPVVAQRLAGFLVCVVVGEPFAGRAQASSSA